MARILAQATEDQIELNSFVFAHLISINLGGGTVERYTSSPYTVTYNSQDYLSSNLLLNVGGVSQSSSLQNSQLGINISTAEGNYASWMQSKNWFNGDVYYYIAAMSTTPSVIAGNPILVFKGLLSTWSLIEGETPSVELIVDSHWADFERINGRRTNNNSQKQFYPTDDGMEYAADSIRDMRWGQS